MGWKRGVTLKTAEEIEIMREAGRINALALDAARKLIRPGVTTAELNAAAEEVIRSLKGTLPDEFWRHRAAAHKEILLALRALIDAAMGIELTALDLYVRMAAQSPSGTASLFSRLAEEERGHMEIIARMRGGMTESS